jgi:hypothetical protein
MKISKSRTAAVSKTKPAGKSTGRKSLSGVGFSGGGSNFDGANYSRFRSYLHGLQATGKGGEVTSWTRKELNRRACKHFNDVPQIRFLAAYLARHTVGIGRFPVAMTSDDDWNAKAEAVFDNWASNKSYCDARGQKTYWQRQRQCITDWFRVGESFVKKSFSAEGFPQFQSFGAHEIGNSGKEKTDEFVTDGVITDKSGKVLGFRVLTADGGHQDIYADSMCHVADFERDDGQLRAPTALYTGLNPAQDLMEAGSAAKIRHKLQSMFTAAVKRTGAGAPVQKSMSSVVSKRGGSGASSGSDQAESAVGNLLEKIGGFGAIAYLADGEELQFLQVQGNDAFEKLSEFLISELAYSIGINPETAFFLSKLGGTANRAGLEDFAAAIMVLADRLDEQLNTPFWVWRIAVAMSRGELPRCKDPRWWQVAWQGPPKMSVDLGRMGTLLINLRNNAMITPDQYWGAQGMGWREAANAIARGIRIEKLACWNASDHKAGEEAPFIVVDYHTDFRVIPGMTALPVETVEPDEEEKDTKEKKKETGDWSPSDA